MRLLLDTQIVIWWLGNVPLIPENMSEAIADRSNEVFVSSASVWEMAIKRSIGKLNVPSLSGTVLRESGFIELPVTVVHANAVESLPFHHKDPFDRLLIAQAVVESLTIVTVDQAFAAYSISRLAMSGPGKPSEHEHDRT